MLQLVCFDWFNTLTYASPTREDIWGRVLSQLGYQIDHDVITHAVLAADCQVKPPFTMKDPEARLQAYLTYPRGIFVGAGIEVTDDVPLRALEAARKYDGEQKFVLFDDVLETLAEIRGRGLKLGLITNASLEMLHIFRELRLDQQIDFVATSEEARAEKPDRRIFELALAKAGIGAEATLHVGDQYAMDIVGALSVGMRAVLIDRYGADPDATYRPRITSLGELAPFLD